jgi:hypothetical protein
MVAPEKEVQQAAAEVAVALVRAAGVHEEAMEAGNCSQTFTII